MPEVLVPRKTPTRLAPKRAALRCTASAKPSACAGQLGQAVVAAVEGGQRPGQGQDIVDAVDHAQPGGQRRGLEVDAAQAAAAFAQRRAAWPARPWPSALTRRCAPSR
jgi:hypothetical protein